MFPSAAPPPLAWGRASLGGRIVWRELPVGRLSAPPIRSGDGHRSVDAGMTCGPTGSVGCTGEIRWATCPPPEGSGAVRAARGGRRGVRAARGCILVGGPVVVPGGLPWLPLRRRACVLAVRSVVVGRFGPVRRPRFPLGSRFPLDSASAPFAVALGAFAVLSSGTPPCCLVGTARREEFDLGRPWVWREPLDTRFSALFVHHGSTGLDSKIGFGFPGRPYCLVGTARREAFGPSHLDRIGFED